MVPINAVPLHGLIFVMLSSFWREIGAAPTQTAGNSFYSNLKPLMYRPKGMNNEFSYTTYVDPTGRSHAIPAHILLTHKYDLRLLPDNQLTESDYLLKKTVERTVASMPDHQVIFYDDQRCEAALRDVSPKLALHFKQEKVGMLKADMCRLAQLFWHGGMYFDADLVPLVKLREYIKPETTFTSVRSTGEIENNEGLFQAFLGATPRHPLIKAALRATVAYYEAVGRGDHSTAMRLTGGFEHGNIGTSILMTVFTNFSGLTPTTGVLSTAMNISQTTRHSKEHVSQMFLESSLSRYDKTWKLPLDGAVLGHDDKGDRGFPPHCEYSIGDRDTKTVIFMSRMFANVPHFLPCLVAWEVFPDLYKQNKLPALRLSHIPRIIQMVGDTEVNGDYEDWLGGNPKFGVKMWTPVEVDLFLADMLNAPLSPVSSSLPLTNLIKPLRIKLFSIAILKKYGGVMLYPAGTDAPVILLKRCAPPYVNTHCGCRARTFLQCFQLA